MSAAEPSEEMLALALRAIGHAAPREGFAGLRFWGQTGERSGAWMAAADPVHLEARLNHLCVRALHGSDLTRAEWRALLDHLQAMLAHDDRFTLVRLGPFAYLRCEVPIATANVSPEIVDGREPDDFMPAGEDAAGHDRLLGEMQMALHDHEVNRMRAAGGKPGVNSIWFWGGGTAPAAEPRTVPPLFADDPLFRGYWASCSGVIRSWTEDIDAVLAHAPDGFVAVAPRDIDESPAQDLDYCLEGLRDALRSGGLERLKLLFRDGLEIDIGKSDAFRFWRRISPFIEE